MIQIEQVTDTRDVVRLRSARQFAGGWAYYFTAAYWVDGLLIEFYGTIHRMMGNLRREVFRHSCICSGSASVSGCLTHLSRCYWWNTSVTGKIVHPSTIGHSY